MALYEPQAKEDLMHPLSSEVLRVCVPRGRNRRLDKSFFTQTLYARREGNYPFGIGEKSRRPFALRASVSLTSFSFFLVFSFR